MEQLSGQDAMFLYGEMDNTPMHIGPVLIYDPSTAPDGIVRFKDILRTFQERLHRSPVFTRKLMNVPLGIDHPFWVDDPNTDVEFHVRHIALPKPGDWRQFCIQIARLHARALDRAHPLWEAYIIEGLDNIPDLPKGSFAMFLKIHHAAMDGATGVEIMGALHDLSPTATVNPPSGKRKRAAAAPGELQLLRKVAGSVLRQPFGLVRMLGEAVPVWRRVQEGKKEKRFRSLGDKERTRFNARVSPHRVFGAVNFDLPSVIAIKNSVPGATVNDVMMTIVAGAMRAYLKGKDELPAKSLVTGAPVNVRTDEEKTSGGNVVSMMSIALRTDVAAPLARLQAVHEEAVGSKAYMNAVGARTLTDWSNRLPAQVTALGFRAASATGLLSTTKPVFNTIITNVPGPQVPLYMAGARLVRSFGAGPCMDGNGLFQVVTSYAGQIAISFQSCRDMMPDPDEYEACLAQSFAELKDASVKLGTAATRSDGAKTIKRKGAKARTRAARIEALGSVGTKTAGKAKVAAGTKKSGRGKSAAATGTAKSVRAAGAAKSAGVTKRSVAKRAASAATRARKPARKAR
ncbi:MAG: wax ester/triacylglycerol synthase family O-acyltransferase [Gammaproteobacteria bacterium]|nr:wax ester/triacylglycerol synthase family O-acyltransferase [Gammaproteobacteria bacterium]